jgi:membrane-associated protein
MLMDVPKVLLYSLTLTANFKYPLVFLGTIIEGPVLMIASGFLYRTGVFDIEPLFIALVLGDLAGDIMWYYLGMFVAAPILKRHGKFLSVTPEKFDKICSLFQRHPKSIIFFSKVTMGFGMAIGTLVAAGATRVPIKTYLFFNALGELVFVSMLLVVGYFFGEIYTKVDNAFKSEYVIIAAIVAVILITLYSKFIKKIVSDNGLVK